MTIDRYINPDFDRTKQLIFLGMAFAGIFLIILIIMFGTRLSVCLVDSNERHDEFKRRTIDNIQLFFEMMISGTSVLVFACAYVICNHIFELMSAGLQAGQSIPAELKWFYNNWDKNKDFVLLFLISISCLINTIIDRILIPLRRISKDDKASIRMLGMFYAICILLIINNNGGEEKFYGPVMMYYFGLMIGRFVYFDASFMDFVYAIWGAIRHSLLLLFGLLLTCGLSIVGFRLKYLIDRNFIIVGVLYTDIFLLIVIFILHHLRGIYLFIRNESDEEYEEYDDYDDDDDDDEDRPKIKKVKKSKKDKKEKSEKTEQNTKKEYSRKTTEKRKEYDSYGGYDNGTDDYNDFDI